MLINLTVRGNKLSIQLIDKQYDYQKKKKEGKGITNLCIWLKLIFSFISRI